MITSDDTITEIECDFELNRDNSQYTGQILLSEGGRLDINFNEGTFRQHNLHNSWDTIEGIDTENRNITVEHAVTSQIRDHWQGRLSTALTDRARETLTEHL